MSIKLPEKSAEFELVPAETHVATCYRVIDLGTQLVEWQGARKQQRKIMLSWELGGTHMGADDRPFSIHRRYTLSSSDKAQLRKDLEAWRGQPFSDEDFGRFDIGVLIGKSCLLQVIHNHANGGIYANIASIMKLPKGMQIPPLVNEGIYFSLSDFKQEIYDKLSENLKAVVAKSPEYQQLKGANHFEQFTPDAHYVNNSSDLNDEIPF